ncbi:MAG: hypothetical protein AB8G22_11780 [Saprospiraceae bacterium]
METKVEKEIYQKILQPKADKLIQQFISVLLGKEKRFVPEDYGRVFYEIWFYLNFDFRYTIIGINNFTIDISEKSDEENLLEILKRYDISDEIHSKNVINLKRKCEFTFFSDCWKKIEQEVKEEEIRCFLVEYGSFAGWDVNDLQLVNGDRVRVILEDEGFFD